MRCTSFTSSRYRISSKSFWRGALLGISCPPFLTLSLITSRREMRSGGSGACTSRGLTLGRGASCAGESVVGMGAAGLSDVWNRSCSLPAFRSSAKFWLMNLIGPDYGLETLLGACLIGGMHRQTHLLPHLDAVYVTQIGVELTEFGKGGLVITPQRPYAQVPNSVVWLYDIREEFRRVRISACACRSIKRRSSQG